MGDSTTAKAPLTIEAQDEGGHSMNQKRMGLQSSMVTCLKNSSPAIHSQVGLEARFLKPSLGLSNNAQGAGEI